MRKRKNFRNWASSISRCPQCGSHELLRLDLELFCGQCDWDNSRAYVEAGGMDSLYAAYQECFPSRKSVPEIFEEENHYEQEDQDQDQDDVA